MLLDVLRVAIRASLSHSSVLASSYKDLVTVTTFGLNLGEHLEMAFLALLSTTRLGTILTGVNIREAGVILIILG
jgi:hypothetical protein